MKHGDPDGKYTARLDYWDEDDAWPVDADCPQDAATRAIELMEPWCDVWEWSFPVEMIVAGLNGDTWQVSVDREYDPSYYVRQTTKMGIPAG